MDNFTADTGKAAEEYAASYIKTLGFEILERNFAVPGTGEIDIIAKNGENLYFIEVKARRNQNTYDADDACVSRKKLARIRKCAGVYIEEKSMDDVYCKIVGVLVFVRPHNKYGKIKLIPLD